MSYKGRFSPKNPSKYKGNPTNIIYRSSWELKFMIYLDAHPNVVKWASEEFCIPYRHPIDGKFHRYYPDFYIEQTNRNGEKETIVVEIKPKKHSEPPKVQQKRTKKYLREVAIFAINDAKWKAAKDFCDDRLWKFMVLTEKELGIK